MADVSAPAIPLADLDRKGLWGTAYGREVWAIGEELVMFSAGHDLRALAAALHEYRREAGLWSGREVQARRQWVHIVDGCGCPPNCQSCAAEAYGCWKCPDCRSEEYQPCGPEKGWTARLLDGPAPGAEPVWAVTEASK